MCNGIILLQLIENVQENVLVVDHRGLSQYCTLFIIFLNSLLPAPTQPVWDRDEERAKARVPSSSLVVASPTAPPYGQRRGWVPRSLEV